MRRKNNFDSMNFLFALPVIFVLILGGALFGFDRFDTDLEIRKIEQLRTDSQRIGCPLPEGVAVKIIETNNTILFKHDRRQGLLSFLLSSKWDAVTLIEIPNCNT